MAKSEFGWTIVRRGGYLPYHVYKQEATPPEDLVKDTFPTKREAEAEARRRNAELGLGAVLGS
jgi:hypothetical protein